jgi:glycosyltransferase involved in cell wall biosynthesis
MRILNVIMSLDPIDGGGSVERIYQLSRHLAIAGEDCTILTTRQGWNEVHSRGLGAVKVVALSYVSERFKIPIGLFAWLRKHLKEYDVVHLAMNWTVITAITYLYLRLHRRPYVYSAMGWVVIDGRSRILKKVYRAIFTRPMARAAECCIAITRREVVDYMRLGIDPSRIALIPNGIGPDAFDTESDQPDLFRRRHGIGSQPFIMFIGRLNPIKGPDLLIGAFARIAARFPEYRLVIAGNNYGFLDELKGLARHQQLEERIIFLGPIFGSEKRSAYRSAALFVIPSRFDTMTIVALEAAAAGAPILLTEQCDFPEIQEANGGLAVDASVGGLAAGLHRLLSRPSELEAMGKRARAFVAREYRWEYVSRQFLDVFRQAVAAARDGVVQEDPGRTSRTHE